jgi:hypothetical protein
MPATVPAAGVHQQHARLHDDLSNIWRHKQQQLQLLQRNMQL